MELVRSFQCGFLSRRDFVARASTALGSLAAANLLAAACVPVTPPPAPVVASPSVEETPADEEGAIVEYGSAEGQPLTGYLARPASDQPAPAVIVIQEWWGLNDHIKDVTRRFAREGFVALALPTPPRLLWYRFGPLEAYNRAGQHHQALELANQVLAAASMLEEALLQQEIAYEAMGQLAAARFLSGGPRRQSAHGSGASGSRAAGPMIRLTVAPRHDIIEASPRRKGEADGRDKLCAWSGSEGCHPL